MRSFSRRNRRAVRSAARAAGSGLIVTAICCAVAFSAAPVAAGAPVRGHAGRAGSGSRTQITVNGQRRGQVFDGIGAISGGGGLARLLIDYPPVQRTQILNYLFGPGGADLQMLKLEIGGDAASSSGAEPSIEHSKGQIDCKSGYEWWLARQAVARNPRIMLIGLQWAAPGWVGNVWTRSDIGYVIDWLNCAKSNGLRISYLGGWNEHGYNIAWYENLRKALDASGYHSVKIIAADSFPGRHYVWARTFNVAKAAAADPAFRKVLNIIGVHDTCRHPTSGYECESTRQARRLGLPIWESEIGCLKGNSAASDLVRAINNSYIQADVNGILMWPMASSIGEDMLYSDRGLVIAMQPQSGFYYVSKEAWAIAQTTQFVQPGWRHVVGASGNIGNTGTYLAYESPNLRDWSLVAQDTGNKRGQTVVPQTITVHLTGGLAAGRVAVWSTNLWSSHPGRWFVRGPVIRPSKGTFSYTIQAGYVVSFTSATGQSHLHYPARASAPMHLPYTTAPDASNEAWGMAPQEGAFLYQPCLDGATGQCIEQMAARKPVFWQTFKAGTPTPYAIVGSAGWANYTVSAKVLITSTAGSAGLIGRFSNQATDPRFFDGYQFDLTGNGHWQLIQNSRGTPKTLTSGARSGIQAGTWHTLTLSLKGSRITALLDGTAVATVNSSAYRAGLAGIESTWSPAQFSALTVR